MKSLKALAGRFKSVLGPPGQASSACAIAVLSLVLVAVFFFPLFYLWKGLDIPYCWSAPEVSRAADTLKQLEYPLTEIQNPSNMVIQWRLLFPVMGFLFGVPKSVFLSLPFLGCLLVLWYVAFLVVRAKGGRLSAFFITAAMATTSWFFVSTGWLAYFDSWCVFFLLVASFSPRPLTLAAACLLAPWIDERFVLAAPTVLVVRGLYFGLPDGAQQRFFGRDLAMSVLGLLPYVALRLLASLWMNDESTTAYVQKYVLQEASPFRFLEGAWAGLRAVWIYVAVFLWAILRSRRLAWIVTATAMVTLSFAVSILIAGDLSRSVSVLVPTSVMGALFLIRTRPNFQHVLMAAILAWNLLSPARHVVTTFAAPIHSLFSELKRSRNPPLYWNPSVYYKRGAVMASHGRRESAIEELTYCLRLDGDFLEALLLRGILFEHAGRIVEADRDLSRARRVASSRGGSLPDLESRLSRARAVLRT